MRPRRRAERCRLRDRRAAPAKSRARSAAGVRQLDLPGVPELVEGGQLDALVAQALARRARRDARTHVVGVAALGEAVGEPEALGERGREIS